MIRFLLALFIPFRGFIEHMGADYNQFIRILRLKLTIDDRRIKGLGKNQQKATQNMLLKQSFTQIFLGIFFSTFLMLIKSAFTFYFFAHMFVMIMMAMMIISEFTTILFDTSDNVIIQPLPIKGNTQSLARNAHVFVYLTLIAFNISVISIITAIVKFGFLSGLIFMFTILANVLFTLFLANTLYLVIMRLASGEHLKNVLMYFQIVIAIIFMAAYQFGVNMVDRSKIQDMILPVHWYTYLVPPAFFSGLTEAFSSMIFDIQHLIFIAEGLILPIIAIYVTGKYLTPVFNRKLMDLEQGDRVSKVKNIQNKRNYWFRFTSKFFVRNAEERSAYQMMWRMTGRERLFKQSFFPSIGYIIIMIIVPFFKKSFDLDELVQGDMYLLILYAFLIVAATLSGSMLIGNNQHAVWIFRTLPVQSPAVYFKGFIKAAFIRFFVPIYGFLGIILCCLWGIRILPDILIALMSIYLITLLFYYNNRPTFPFASEKIATQGGSSAIKFFMIMAIAVAIGFLHKILIHWFTMANLLLIPVYILTIFWVNKKYVFKKITWDQVDKENNYS